MNKAMPESDRALEELLRASPDALVAALGPEGRLVPIPDSVSLHGQGTYGGVSGIDLVVQEDQVAIIDGWARAQREPVVHVRVRLLADPEHLGVVHFFDVRAQHGVHVIVVQGYDLAAVLRSAQVRPESGPGVACVKKDAAAVFLDVDDATTALLGWSRDELVGRPTADLVHPDDFERAFESWMAMRESGATGRTRVRMRHKNGNFVWIEVTNQNRLDDPAHRCVLAEMVDISEEMSNLQALRDRERLLARLAEALPIGICHLRADRGVVYCNEPMTALLGEITDIADLLHCVCDRDRDSLAAALDQAFEGRTGHVEVGVSQGFEERRCELTLRTMADDDGVIDGVIVCAADVTDRSRLRAELEHRATTDALTGCLNRAATTAAVERLLRDGREVTVAFIDLDRFKTINDELGHAAGDEVLRVAAARLRGVTRTCDVLGRLGGDEFVVICTTDGSLDPASLAERLETAINGDVTFARQRIPLRASIGAAVSLEHEVDAEALLQRADAAMYAAKRLSKEAVLDRCNELAQHAASRSARSAALA